jgi:hypothetical protein
VRNSTFLGRRNPNRRRARRKCDRSESYQTVPVRVGTGIPHTVAVLRYEARNVPLECVTVDARLTSEGAQGLFGCQGLEQAGRLIVPVQRRREKLLLELRAVVGTEKEIAAGEGNPNVRLRATAIATVEGRKGVVQLAEFGIVVECAVLGGDLRHVLLHSKTCW